MKSGRAQMDLEMDAKPSVATPQGSFIKKGIKTVDQNIKLFGLFTLLTCAVVVGMSVYVVHYKEFRFSVNGKNFVNDAGELMVTDTPKSELNGLSALYGAVDLKKLDKLDFFVALKDDNAEVSMTVDKVVRKQSGTLTIYGSSGTDKFTTDGNQAWYKDNGECAEGSGCSVIFSTEDEKKAAANRKPGTAGRRRRRLRRKLWGSVGRWIKSLFTGSTTTEPTDPEEKADTHDYPNSEFKIKPMLNVDVLDKTKGMKWSPDSHPEEVKGVWWLDQHGAFKERMDAGKATKPSDLLDAPSDSAYYESDVKSVAAADGAITFGKSKHYKLPEPETWTVDGVTYELKHRFDTEVGAGGADAWQWFNEGSAEFNAASEVENHSFDIASKLGLFYKFIWNDEFTFCRIAFTAKLPLIGEVEMPSALATYWMKRGWKGKDDPSGVMWDRISYIGYYKWQSTSSQWHYPVFKITTTTTTDPATGAYTLAPNRHFADYERALDCKCAQSDDKMGAATAVKVEANKCIREEPDANPKCKFSGIVKEFPKSGGRRAAEREVRKHARHLSWVDTVRSAWDLAKFASPLSKDAYFP